ncbi:amidohydrolase [Calderihabitans maritimus]|uniref:Amidohydrolase n=1 Tax=Calderihabitans maritimus TaxID=1246530 RepID=A0A1Z5HT83_9FIRM|nr:amidohydrolase [Calderihabitans maritimus]
MVLALVGGTVLTMEGPVYSPGTVLIKDGKICGVGERLPLPPEAEVLDVTGKVVMPGLVEAHCHLGILEEIYRIEGNDLNEISDPVTPHLRALDAVNPEDEGFKDALAAGITTVLTGPGSANVIGGQTLVMKTHGTVVDKMVLRQPAGLKVAFGENPKRVHGEQQKKQPATRMAITALLREQLVKAQNYLKKLSREEGERDLRLEPLVQVLRKEIPLQAHVHRADDIMTALRIAGEFQLDLILVHCTEGHKVVEELARYNVPVIVGPTLTSRSKVELKERTFRTPALLSKAGVKVALMTDHPVIPVQYLPLCAALAVKEGMAEEEALKAITLYPAQILGVAHRVGSIAPGKDADIIVASGSLLDLKSRVEMVLVNGEVVVS